jgi:hypothetical protein
MFEMFHTAFDHATFDVEDVIAEGTMCQYGCASPVCITANSWESPPPKTPSASECATRFALTTATMLEHWGLMDTTPLLQQLTAD